MYSKNEPPMPTEGLPISQTIPTETTPLLSTSQGFPFHNTQHHTSGFVDSPNETFTDGELDPDHGEEEEEIDQNEFDLMLSKSNSYTSGLGMGPESIESAMLRNPPNHTKPLSRTTSRSSRYIGDPESLNQVKGTGESPFLGGVSVSQFWIIFAGILANYFVACFDGTIMASSHPVITSYFHASNSASWLSTAFLLTSTAFQPVFGRLSDTIGRRPPFLLSLFLFLVATLWCALAQSMTSFILARAICGLAAGGVTSMGSIITSDLVPIEIRGAYQAYINIVYGAGGALGAALGGLIADKLGWRWEFGFQVPLLAVLFVVAFITTPSDLGLERGQKRKSFTEAARLFDWKGSLLLTSSVAFLILGLNLGGNVYPWKHPLIITSLALFTILFPLFLYTQTSTFGQSHTTTSSCQPLPIMPLHLITTYPRAGLIISNFIATIIVHSILFNIPLYFQAVLLESATSSGLRLIPPSLVASAMGASTGLLITYTRRLFWPFGLGSTLFVIGTVCLAVLLPGANGKGTMWPDWAYGLFLLPTSAGQGFIFPGTFMAVLAVSERSEMAVVTGTLILWRSLGSVVGVAVSSLVIQNGLVRYLDLFVTGTPEEKLDIINRVRKSVQAIATLDPMHKAQVIEAYAASLRVTFSGTVVLAVVLAAVIVPIKLPRLGKRA